jgi:hypothetical protein
MKTDILKRLIKEAVKEAIHEEMKDILLEAVRGNKQPITESNMKTLNFTTKNIPTPQSNFNAKQAYMDVLNETAETPKSGFEGEFKINGGMNTISEGSALPGGQLGLDQIMSLMNGK